MHGPNPWPSADLLPGWEADVSAYFSSALAVSRALSRGLALALGLDRAFFEQRMRDPVAQLLLLRYPPAPPSDGGGGDGGSNSSAARRVVGCGEHTDCGFLTLLAQDDVPGLEVRPRAAGAASAAAATANSGGGGGEGGGDDAGWVPAPPLPGALLVNLGDLAEFWSGGLFRSTPHRVFAPGGADGRRARHSVVFFCNCDYDAEVAPLGAEAGMGSDEAGGRGAADAGNGGGVDGTSATTAGRYICEKLGLMYDE
jgi:isopenicillin N synthase-like dioxygenase